MSCSCKMTQSSHTITHHHTQSYFGKNAVVSAMTYSIKFAQWNATHVAADDGIGDVLAGAFAGAFAGASDDGSVEQPLYQLWK
eukprot:m.32685 g.32685  ORF g.32685 m.32685 type:complete len:83 (+) comp6398_c0_seq1:132-380(+)